MLFHDSGETIKMGKQGSIHSTLSKKAYLQYMGDYIVLYKSIESFRFEDENEDEDEDEALGFRHKEIFKLFRLQLGRDDEVDCNNIVPA